MKSGIALHCSKTMKENKYSFTISKKVFPVLISFLFFSSPQMGLGNQAGVQIDPNKVAGFEVIVAGKCGNDFACQMGHSMLRIVGKSGNPGDDFVIGYTTPVESNETPMDVTLTGLKGRTLMLEVGQLKNLWDNYALKENREMTRIPLQLSPQVKEKLVQLINENHFKDGKIRNTEKGGYTILRSNCAGKIADLLREAGTPSQIVGIAIPTQLETYLFRNYIANYSHIEVKPTDGFNGNFDRLPEEFYGFCKDQPCARTVIANLNRVLPKAKIDMLYQTRPNAPLPDPEYRDPKETRTMPNHWNSTKKADVVKHYELLLDTRKDEVAKTETPQGSR